MAFRIEYSPEAEDHLRTLTARQRTMILARVNEQLACQPTMVTRNRKPMLPNDVAGWELRIENLRVYYDVIHEAERVVVIRAIGVKLRNKVRIGKEVREL